MLLLYWLIEVGLTYLLKYLFVYGKVGTYACEKIELWHKHPGSFLSLYVQKPKQECMDVEYNGVMDNIIMFQKKKKMDNLIC